MSQRVVCLSDTHLRAGQELPKWVELQIGQSDLVLHCGDFVDLSVLERLSQLAPVEAVAGNMDEPRLKRLLPSRRTVPFAGVTLGLIHDPGPVQMRHERLLALFPGCDAVLYGHVHRPDVHRQGQRLTACPGAVSNPRSSAASLLLLQIAEGEIELELKSS